MLKKILAIGISLVILSIGITGCGSGSTENNEISKEKLVTLKYYTIGGPTIDLDLVEGEINKYLEEKINVNIDLEVIDFGDYNQKTSIMINSGEQFDLMFTCSWAGDYLGNSRKGAFLDLTPYLDNTGKDMYEAIDSRFWEGSAIDGKNYGVPTQKELAMMPMWRFTKEYVDKYDIPYQELQSLEDLEPWLKVIKENEPDVIPLFTTGGGYPPQNFERLALNVGIEIGDETLTIKNLWETDQFINDVETLKRYYDAGYINKDSAIGTDDGSRKRFITKADGQPYAELIWSQEQGYDIVATSILDSVVTNESATGALVAVSANSKNPEKAVEFLNLVNTDPYLRNLFNYGIEDIHYTKVEGKDNTIKLAEDYYTLPYFALGNLFITYVLDTEPETKWEEFQHFNDEAMSSPILGFKFNTEPVLNEVSAINNVILEFERTLYSGTVDTDQYLKWANDKLYEQGMQKVIDEMQKQLDEWLKAQK